ncbi:MAG: hypothetical protein F2837_11485 [Actinobacteria bacterium]|nr:hypothetical protein [Actinomycetota bacterium]
MNRARALRPGPLALSTLRYLGAHDDTDESHGPEADVVIDDHAELLMILGA